MYYFPYGDAEVNYLKSRDEKLGRAIKAIGWIKREVIPDPFEALIKTVVSQQISSKAAKTVSRRLDELLGHPFVPKAVLDAGPAAIQQCGLSMRKAEYIIGIAQAAERGVVDFDALASLPDQEVIRKLTTLRGVGVWSAEMVLIFSLCRPNVVSYGDLGIRRGMKILYGLEDLPKEAFTAYAQRYSPYGSVASLYLWHLAGQG